MHLFFILFSIITVVLYCILIISFYFAWEKYPAFESSDTPCNLFVSIIIPSRNEEFNISGILSDLAAQDFDLSGFEIIVVNDHSEDGTIFIAEEFNNKFPYMKVIDLPDGSTGKKIAILYAITRAKGELVVTLDADCRLGKSWLSSIVSFYCMYKPKLIIGPLLYNNANSMFEQMQSIEIEGLVASGAGASVMGHAIMCNGANLAFTRDAYWEAVSSLKYETASGDDIFLMLTVKNKWPKEIRFLKSKKAVVLNNPVRDIKNFIQQRKRWTSKARFYKDADIIATAILVYISNFAIVTTLFSAFFLPELFFLFFILLIVKSLSDLLLLNSFTSSFNRKIKRKYFWIAQLIYPFYIVTMAIYGNTGKFKWKNRTYL
jgi:cellulose synthase/poly-beta-1,6-N-acetylglucosamine synthase-like glycosyltransferase